MDGRCKRVKVHALVARAFIGPRPDGHQINHIDANPVNNRVENLEYVTPRGNMQHCVKLGRRAKGHEINTSKLVEKDVRKIRQLLDEGMHAPTLGKIFGVSHQTIYSIRDRKIWKHL
jgi:hypothetical protein